MEYAVIEQAAKLAVEENNAFLVELEVKPNNVIIAFIDSDEGLNMDQIKMINRRMEAEFDREIEDFNLTISSPDLNRPLRTLRQYKKNIGRFLKVKFSDREEEGELLEVTEEYIVLSVPQQKKSAPNQELKIDFSDLTEAKVAIRFK
ncbi:MAG TPA: ribosome assembly cofactor RimP [Cryomorphaceae bacterium]|nr:ribosome assembly cofactor RimP [Cryomorphaceae bacterium]|tara:strand:- start:275 stop:715 length:441 start_codon:yes stop_codon:yes gene_type:complete